MPQGPLGVLRSTPLRLQISLMFGSVAVVSAALTASLMTLAVRVSLADAAPGLVADTTRGVGVVAVLVTMCTVTASLGAAAYLTASIRRTVTQMEAATAAIAAGEFGHRIRTSRTDELGALARSIDRTAGTLQRLELSRRHMLASVSHELRTPLTIIRGHAYTLARHEPVAARQARFEVIDAEAERLAGIIDQLLEAATLRARGVQLQVEPVPIGALLADVGDRFSQRAAERGVEVRISGARRLRSVLVACDPDRIHQVIGNLVANALAHSPQGSQVSISAHLDQHAGRVRFSVVDQGRGVDRADRDAIFEPFEQGELATGAVGLGLTIARDIVAAHGGVLRLDDAAVGASFSFDLPRDRAVDQTIEVRSA